MNKELKQVELRSYYLPLEIIKRLKILSATSGITQSNLVEEALQDLFKKIPGGQI